jgi:hypothetical protein
MRQKGFFEWSLAGVIRKSLLPAQRVSVEYMESTLKIPIQDLRKEKLR